MVIAEEVVVRYNNDDFGVFQTVFKLNFQRPRIAITHCFVDDDDLALENIVIPPRTWAKTSGGVTQCAYIFGYVHRLLSSGVKYICGEIREKVCTMALPTCVEGFIFRDVCNGKEICCPTLRMFQDLLDEINIRKIYSHQMPVFESAINGMIYFHFFGDKPFN